MTRIHLKKKDVVKSSAKGISIEFDHERLVAILDVPRRTGICEYIKEVWEESRYTKPLEITVRFANDATIMKAEECNKRDETFSKGKKSHDVNTKKHSSSPSFIFNFKQKIKNSQESTLGSYSRDAELPSSSRFERKRANRFHDESEKAKAENAKLLALTSQNPNQTPSLVSIVTILFFVLSHFEILLFTSHRTYSFPSHILSITTL
ncbi:hypothetical protein Dimus_032102 [Dionaea muscipula]